MELSVQTATQGQVEVWLANRGQQPLQPGQLVRGPLGQRDLLGVVWSVSSAAPDLPPSSVRDVSSVLQDLAPLGDAWRQLVQFSAQYYQRSLGEVALSALPPQLRDLTSEQLARRLKKQNTDRAVQTTPGPALSPEQSAVPDQMAEGTGPFCKRPARPMFFMDRLWPTF